MNEPQMSANFVTITLSRQTIMSVMQARCSCIIPRLAGYVVHRVGYRRNRSGSVAVTNGLTCQPLLWRDDGWGEWNITDLWLAGNQLAKKLQYHANTIKASRTDVSRKAMQHLDQTSITI